MYHIIVNKNNVEENRGYAKNRDSLVDLLRADEIKTIFDHDAWIKIDDFFKELKKSSGIESCLNDINGIQVTCVTDGFKIHTLVFYF